MIGLIRLSRLPYSKIGNSLKALQLSPPTTHKDIKNKYMLLVKQLHPDMRTDEKDQKSKEQLDRDHHKFVEIAQAYKYLKELS